MPQNSTNWFFRPFLVQNTNIEMRNLLAVLALAAILGTPTIAPAQASNPEQKQETPAKPELTEDQKAAKKYEEKIKDLKKFTGDFTFYQRKNEILIELTHDQLGKLFCAQATISSGVGTDGLQAGDPLNADAIDVFEFRRGPGEDIQLVKPNLAFRFEESNPLATSSKRSFPIAILDNYSIEAEDPVKKLILINATDFFHGDLFNVRSATGTAGSGYQPDKQNYGVESIRSFPENAVVRYQLHFKKMGGGDDGGLAALLAALFGISGPPLADSRSLPLTINYNLWFRRETGYQPRLADPRIGYFTTDYFDVAKFNTPDRTTRLIQRYNLKKKDPTAALSEPIKPIVWYLDNSIPEAYKQGVRDGILYWQSAFEKAGFKNALVVKDAPADEDFHHADGRFNVVRWTMTENSPYAVAWFRPDPISGEILNSGVTVDANYPAGAFTEFQDEVVGRTQHKPWFDSETREDLIRTQVDPTLNKHGFHRTNCNHANGLAEHASFAYNLMKAKNVPVDEKEYVRLMIADLVAHEVGHCLGLRHNFAGSTYKSTADLKNYEEIKKTAIASSVMDYTPLNLVAILEGHPGYYNPVVGPYDNWAIEYGYKEFNGLATNQEPIFLNDITRKYGMPGLLYLTDEDADGINPLSVRWDLGSDLIESLKVNDRAATLLRNYAINGATPFNQSYARRNSLILRTIRTTFRNATIASRTIGGIEFRRHLRGDLLNTPNLRPVTAKEQTDAMKFIMSTALATDSLKLPADVLLNMAQDPNAGGSDYNAPLRSYIANQQMLTAANLMSPDRISNILENEFKSVGNTPVYRLETHYKLFVEGIFSELKSTGSITPLRRDLQTYALENLINQVAAPMGTMHQDGKLLATMWLESLKDQIKTRSTAGKTDQMTKLHLKAMAKAIDEHLEPVDEDQR